MPLVCAFRTGLCPCLSSPFLPSPFQPYTIFPVSLCALSLRVFCACSCLFPPSWQSIWRPVEPPTGWHVSAYRLPGCTVAVRPHSGHGAALLHTLELCTPGVPTVVLWYHRYFSQFCLCSYVYSISLFSFALCLWVRVMYIRCTATSGPESGHQDIHIYIACGWCGAGCF